MKGSTGKRTKKLGNRNRSKKKRNLTEGYQENTRQNLSTVGEIRSTRGKGRGNGTKIGLDGNIPWDEES